MALLVSQVIHFVQSRFIKGVNPNVFHGFILMGNDTSGIKPENLIAEEVGFVGIRTASKHYSRKSRPHIEHMTVYTPKDERVRETLLKAIDVTAYNKMRAKSDAEYAKKQHKPQYASRKLITSLFQNAIKQASKLDHPKRVEAFSMTLADLILEKQLTEKNAKNLRKFHCVGYTTTLLQGVTLLVQFSDKEKEVYSKLDRQELIEILRQRILGKGELGAADPLRQTYAQNEFCQINGASCTLMVPFISTIKVHLKMKLLLFLAPFLKAESVQSLKQSKSLL